jgi:hypothetical protein
MSKLTQFKYVPVKDTGINADKQKVLYNIVFPAGKAVEVPDELVGKMRTKSEFVEVSSTVEKTEADLQREKEAKDAAKAKKDEKPPTGEELEELKRLAEAEKARIAQVQNDAKLGR